MFEVDVRGFSCPVPVVKTRHAMKKYPGEELAVLVETAVCRENVSRLAKYEGYTVRVEPVGDEYRLHLVPSMK
ncbi:MAG: sulfurtransferase TusA family protein [Dehalococcoidales bacterium]|nr:sulfurtransferase TusA family protein [Dehalococcoidales bacterium]